MDTKEKKAKTWMMVIETKSHRGLSCYRKVLFVTAANHHEAQAKARDWCSGEQITSISILPFDPNQMGDAMIDCTEKNPLPEHPNIDSRWIAKYQILKWGEIRLHPHSKFVYEETKKYVWSRYDIRKKVEVSKAAEKIIKSKKDFHKIMFSKSAVSRQHAKQFPVCLENELPQTTLSDIASARS